MTQQAPKTHALAYRLRRRLALEPALLFLPRGLELATELRMVSRQLCRGVYMCVWRGTELGAVRWIDPAACVLQLVYMTMSMGTVMTTSPSSTGSVATMPNRLLPSPLSLGTERRGGKSQNPHHYNHVRNTITNTATLTLAQHGGLRSWQCHLWP